MIIYLFLLINYLICCIKINHLSHMEEKNKENKFEDLLPKSNIDYDCYSELLDKAFKSCSTSEKKSKSKTNNKKNEDFEEYISNVGITGIFGSGKSSILNSYLKKNNLNDITIRISLCSFCNNEKNDIKKSLELKIINQILHQVGNNEIPKSRLKTTPIFSRLNIFWIFLAFSLLFYFVTFGKSFKDTLSSWLFYHCELHDWIYIVLSIGYTFFLSGLIIYVVSIIITNMRLKFFKISNIEASVSEKKDCSYFDDYLEEIVYILSITKKKIIVFEDIDRYQDSIIFERLKEINFLVNQIRKKKNQNGILIFCYVVSDDLFEDYDRVKFFDLIIPIVPVINTSSSIESLNDKVGDFIDKELLLYTSLIIFDLRLINNICNEFYIYKNSLKNKLVLENSFFSYDKLFSIIVIKNLYPKEFALLQVGKGHIYDFINNNSLLGDDFDSERKSFMEYLRGKNYLNKTYKFYLSRSQLTKLTEQDRKYWINYIVGDQFNPEYKLDNPKLLVENYLLKYNSKGIRNYDLFNYLILNKPEKVKEILKFDDKSFLEFFDTYLMNILSLDVYKEICFNLSKLIDTKAIYKIGLNYSAIYSISFIENDSNGIINILKSNPKSLRYGYKLIDPTKFDILKRSFYVNSLFNNLYFEEDLSFLKWLINNSLIAIDKNSLTHIIKLSCSSQYLHNLFSLFDYLFDVNPSNPVYKVFSQKKFEYIHKWICVLNKDMNYFNKNDLAVFINAHIIHIPSADIILNTELNLYYDIFSQKELELFKGKLNA